MAAVLVPPCVSPPSVISVARRGRSRAGGGKDIGGVDPTRVSARYEGLASNLDRHSAYHILWTKLNDTESEQRHRAREL